MASLVSHCHIHMLWFEWHRKLYTNTKQGTDDMLQSWKKWQWTTKLCEIKTHYQRHFQKNSLRIKLCFFFLGICSWSAWVVGQTKWEPRWFTPKVEKKWQWTTTNLRGDKNPSPFPLKLTPQLCFFLGIFSCWTALREACPKFSIFSSNCSCVCAVGFALVNWTAHYIYGFQFIIIRALLREAGLFFCVKESCNFAPQKN